MANKINIQNIHVNNYNVTVTALVIAKSDYKIFESKFVPGDVTGVMSITLRDSELHTINLIIWSKEAELRQVDLEIDVGSIVNVTDAKVRPIRIKDQSYNPATWSPFELVINGATQIVIVSGTATDYLRRLLHLPNKPILDLLSLNDANQCGLHAMNGSDQNVDLLVVVRSIRPARDIILTKTQTTKQYREVVVMDRTFSAMPIKLWGNASIRRSDRWCKGTVLLLDNIRVMFCNYRKATFLVVTGRTILQEDPAVPEAEDLRQLVLSIPNEQMDNMMNMISEPITDVSSINTVMTAQQIFDNVSNSNGNGPFTALCYAMIIKFDLDGFNKIYRKICVSCRSYLRFFSDYCEKAECIDKFTATGNASHWCDLIFDINVGIADHTGTLMCRLAGKYAETLLQRSVEDFLTMSEEERAALKWQFLLERHTIKLVVKPKSAEFYRNTISIVDCVLADPEEVTQRIQIY